MQYFGSKNRNCKGIAQFQWNEVVRSSFQNWYLQLIIPQYFISNKSGIWSLSLIVHSKG